MNWHTLFFMIGAVAACGAAIGMVFTRNVIRMAMLLVASLGAVALLFLLAGADFVGAMQLMIYVGGTLVLIVFGVMLTTGGGTRDGLPTRSMAGTLAAMTGVSLLTLLLIASGLLSPTRWNAANCPATTVGCGGCERELAGEPGDVAARIAAAGTKPLAPTSGQIGMALVGIRTDVKSDAHEHGHDESCEHDSACEHCESHEHSLPTGYMLPFEIISVHLVVVLIAAAYLARSRQRTGASPR